MKDVKDMDRKGKVLENSMERQARISQAITIAVGIFCLQKKRVRLLDEMSQGSLIYVW